MNLFLAALVLAAGCDAKSGDESKPAPAAKTPAAPPADAAAPAIEVSARQLFDDYSANEVRADDRYRGKLLHVIGRVEKIGKVLDEPFVALDGVNAHFVDAGGLARLMPGEAIAIRCRGGGATIGTPMLDACVIDVDTPTDPNAFIPDPGDHIRITVDAGGKELSPKDTKVIAEAAVAARNHCRATPIKADPLGDLWNTAVLTSKRSGEDFVVTVTFDDRRKAVHHGRSPRIEVNGKLTRIRALNDDAKALCAL